MIWILWKGVLYCVEDALIGVGQGLDRSAIAVHAAGFLDLARGEVEGLVVEEVPGGFLLRQAGERPAEGPQQSLVLFQGLKVLPS